MILIRKNFSGLQKSFQDLLTIWQLARLLSPKMSNFSPAKWGNQTNRSSIFGWKISVFSWVSNFGFFTEEIELPWCNFDRDFMCFLVFRCFLKTDSLEFLDNFEWHVVQTTAVGSSEEAWKWFQTSTIIHKAEKLKNRSSLEFRNVLS